jgi:hypothetical protein
MLETSKIQVRKRIILAILPVYVLQNPKWDVRFPTLETQHSYHQN